jgi:hypothetical protein
VFSLRWGCQCAFQEWNEMGKDASFITMNFRRDLSYTCNDDSTGAVPENEHPIWKWYSMGRCIKHSILSSRLHFIFRGVIA